MLVLFWILLSLALIAALLSVDLDVHEYRLRRRNLLSIDEIQDRTGWSRSRIEEVLGPLPPERAYPLKADTYAQLPRDPWHGGPDHPFLHVVSLAGLTWTAGWTITTGRPDWMFLAVFGGYQALHAAWDLSNIIRKPDDDDLFEQDGVDEEDATLVHLQSEVERDREDTQATLRRVDQWADMPGIWHLLIRGFLGYFLRRTTRLEKRIETLGAEYTRLTAKHEKILTKLRWERMRAKQEGDGERERALTELEQEITTSFQELHRESR